ncbi:MAG TPA: tripartite tricarboxylate transporter substrate binding protein [Usitatibacter sp.]|nr:tripartite tricarboxylate transporter substrate binding protein [Usitatibacter sp.]
MMIRALAAWLAALAATAAMGEPYPSKPVKIIVPFAAGGPADIYARVLAEKLQASLGQSFLVEDRPGGGAILGTELVVQSPPDGYTLLMMSNTHTVNESLIPDKRYVLMRDLVPVAPVNYSDLVMVVHPSVKAANLREFIALARAEPGKLNYASSGPGTPYHMAGELFKAMAGVDIVHIPYKGSSGARTDVLGGQVQMMFDAITTMAPNVRAGKLRALATTGKVRSSVLPDVPTLDEAGVPGYESVIWLGVMAPAAAPRAIVEKLNAEITKITSSPELRKAWAEQGAVAMTMTPEEFAAYMRTDIEKWARVVKVSGAKADR